MAAVVTGEAPVPAHKKAPRSDAEHVRQECVQRICGIARRAASYEPASKEDRRHRLVPVRPRDPLGGGVSLEALEGRRAHHRGNIDIHRIAIVRERQVMIGLVAVVMVVRVAFGIPHEMGVWPMGVPRRASRHLMLVRYRGTAGQQLEDHEQCSRHMHGLKSMERDRQRKPSLADNPWQS